MKTVKTDHRSKYTQMVIKEGLLKLLADKPLNKIAVAELCSAADVNRGTFYNHFYDVYDVYESIENDFFEEIKIKLGNVKIFELERPFYKEIMLLVYKNADLIRVLLKNLKSSEFLKRVIEFVKDKYINEWSENYKHIPISFFEQVFSYSTNGAIGLMSDWIQSGMKQPLDEISETIGAINDVITNNIIKNRKA